MDASHNLIIRDPRESATLSAAFFAAGQQIFARGVRPGTISESLPPPWAKLLDSWSPPCWPGGRATRLNRLAPLPAAAGKSTAFTKPAGFPMSRRSLITGVLLFLAGLVGYAVAVAQEAAPRAAPAPAELKTLEEKAAYAIGLNFGQRILADDLGLSPEVIARGLSDALKKAKPALTEEELETTMLAFSRKMQAKAAAAAVAQDPDAAKNLKEGQDFLAKNKLVKGVVTTESGLQYQVITAGKGPSPKRTDTVRVHYHGTLLSGKVFDSSVERKMPAEFAVNRVIAGWTEALQKMKVGDKWKLFIPSDLAYGPDSPGDPIGPNAMLVFEVELLEIVK